MKHLSFLLTTLLLTFLCVSASAQFTQSEMLKEWQRAKAYTKEYLDAMPGDGYAFKPTPEIRSFAQQMLHLADLNYAFASFASGKPTPFGHTSADHYILEHTAAQTKEATTKMVMDSYDFIITILQNMTADRLQEQMNSKNPDVTRFGIFGKAFEHQTHHRGQATIYLRLKGITPPAEKLF